MSLFQYIIAAVLVAAVAQKRGYANQPKYPSPPAESAYPSPGLAQPSLSEPVYPSGRQEPVPAQGSYDGPYPTPKNTYDRPQNQPRPHHHQSLPKIYSPPLRLDTYISPVSYSESVSPPYSDPYSRGHGPTYSTHTSQTFKASVYPENLPQAQRIG